MGRNTDNLLDFDGTADTIEGDYDDISELQEDIDSELGQMFADFDGGDLDQLEVRIYRPREGKGKLAYVFACLPTELPILDKLRDEYGGGDFEVRLIKNKKIFKRFQVAVEAPPKTQIVGQRSETASLASAMTEGFTRLGELMLNIAKPVENPNPNPVNLIEMQSGMMQNMLSMKELLGGQQKQPSPISQLKEMLELKELLGGGTEDKDANTNDVLVALINGVAPALSAIGMSEGVSGVPAKVKQNPVPGTQPKQEIKQELTKDQKNMKMQLMYLCTMAKKDVDPTPYAQMTVDNTPVEKLEDLLEFVCDEDKAIENMVNIHSKVGEYREWFIELGECVKEILTEGLTDNEDRTIIPEDNTDRDAIIVPESTADSEKTAGTTEINGANSDDSQRERGNVGHSETDERIGKDRQEKS